MSERRPESETRSPEAQGPASRVMAFATDGFLLLETAAYVILGLLLAAAAMVGVFEAATTLWAAVADPGDVSALVLAIDRLLFVIMVVEILHTVRVSFRSGALVCEPFLIVGLIASIRRVLVLTLEATQARRPGQWTPGDEIRLGSMVLELGSLSVLILVMVICIYLLRRSARDGASDGGRRRPADRGPALMDAVDR